VQARRSLTPKIALIIRHLACSMLSMHTPARRGSAGLWTLQQVRKHPHVQLTGAVTAIAVDPAPLLKGHHLVRGPYQQLAAGSGQAAVELAKRYDTVVAQDSSQAQLAKAEQRDGIHYEIAAAEATNQPVESVDLVTCAQAMHWCGPS